jgi:hypothetical protein
MTVGISQPVPSGRFQRIRGSSPVSGVGPSGPNSVHIFRLFAVFSWSEDRTGAARPPSNLSQCSTLELPLDTFGRDGLWPPKWQLLLRKEVIQPHLPVRLPCYDLVLITDPTFDGSLQKVRPPASGVTDFHDLTGGVYKARERIHRSVADLRLLATPTSWGRVADPNPN